MIDREQASCSEQRVEGYTDHFRTIMAQGMLFIEAFDIGSGSRRLCLEFAGQRLFALQPFAMQIRHSIKGSAAIDEMIPTSLLPKCNRL
jgi:hypothetical protein